MKEPNLETALAKFDVGDGLSDGELSPLLNFYTVTSENIQALGPEFALARNELYRRLDRLTSYEYARNMR